MLSEEFSRQQQRLLSPLQAAGQYLSFGWQPIPIPRVNGQPTKGPTYEGWSELILSEAELPEHFSASVNIGLLLGKPSGGLVDVDIDSTEALLIAPALLPPTRLISGRVGNLRSHWWYIVDDPTIRTTKLHYTLKGEKDVTLIELRGTGGQTVVPPSLHPEGDRYEWHEWGAPAHVSAAALLRIVKKIALGAMLARFWPLQGAKHDAGLPIAGLFFRTGWTEEEAAELVLLAAQAAGHQKPSDRKAAVHDTYRKAATGQRTQGISTLKDYMPEEIVTTLAKWASEISPHPSQSLTVAEVPWPEPQVLPEGRLAVPTLAEVMIPDPWRSWLVDIAERMQCPLEFPTIGALVSLASLVGRRMGIRPKRHDHEWLVIPNLWGAVIGRPGIMKSPALAEVLKPIKWLEMQARTRHTEALHQWEQQKLVIKAKREEFERKIKEAVKKGEDARKLFSPAPSDDDTPPTPLRFLVNDATVEKLGEILNQNPHGVLLFRDELTGWFRTLDREGHENDRAFYLEAWNGTGSYTYDRIGRGTLYIEAACVSILGGIQPGPLTDYLKSTLRGGAGDDGLLQRFQLSVYPDDSLSWRNVDCPPDKTAKQRAYVVFEKLHSVAPIALGAQLVEEEEIPFFRFAPDAQELFNGWRADLEHKLRFPHEHPVIEAHLSKYRSLMPSLALLFHLVEVIDGKAAGAVSQHATATAAAWCDFLEAHARRIYQGATQRGLFAARQLAERIQAGRLPSPFTPHNVYHNGWTGLSTAEDVEHATDLLEGLCWIRSEKVFSGVRGGRPRFHYHINPRLRVKDLAA